MQPLILEIKVFPNHLSTITHVFVPCPQLPTSFVCLTLSSVPSQNFVVSSSFAFSLTHLIS